MRIPGRVSVYWSHRPTFVSLENSRSRRVN